MAEDIILETRGLTKEFKGFVAVDRVDLKVKRGTIHALIGPNGAGKTTTFNLLTKFLPPTAGHDPLQRPRHHAREARGRGAPRHHPLLPDLRRLPQPHGAGERAHRAAARARHELPFLEGANRSLDALNDRALALLERVDLRRFAQTNAVELAYGRKRTLEIATTLAMEPELMLLDEPTSGMGHEDVDLVKNLIKEVAKGRTVLMVEHNMGVVSGICDTITVLQRGAVLTEGPYAEVSANPQVIEAYMGSTEAAHG